MTQEQTFRKYKPDAEMTIHDEVIAEAFNSPVDKIDDWSQRAGYENIRTQEIDGEFAGTCLMVPMGQYFGKDALPMCGVAGVAINPIFRSQGVAKLMMSNLIKEMAATDAVISTLYASTLPLYRSVGYEVSGSWYEVKMKFSEIPRIRDLEPNLRVLPMQKSDRHEVEALNEELTKNIHGSLKRGPYCWQRIFDSQHSKSRTYVVKDQQENIQGTLSFIQLDGGKGSMWHKLKVNQFDAKTPEALKKLLHFLSSYGAMADELTLLLQPDHPVLLLLPEQHWSIHIKERWLMRILSLKKALESRVYYCVDDMRVNVRVIDEILPENNGVFSFEYLSGQFRCTRAEKADVEMHIGALAPLFSGLYSASDLAISGRLTGNESAVKKLDTLFLSPSPIMMDMF